MFLIMTAAGIPVWRVRYRYRDPAKGLVERIYSIGVYPAGGQP